MAIIILSVFITGLIGGFAHCYFMCGPLVFSYSSKDTEFVGKNKFTRTEKRAYLFLSNFLFTLGRITGYGITGFIAGASGSFILLMAKTSIFRGIFELLIGLTLILMALSFAPFIKLNFHPEKFMTLFSPLYLKLINSKSKKHILSSRFIFGIMIGFLPCMLSLTVAITAAGTMSAFYGALVMAAFAVGTAIPLNTFALLSGRLYDKLKFSNSRIWLASLASLIVLAVGVLFILRALSFENFINLGHSYLVNNILMI
ncbi:MAG: sulfite exporter TauE/SafE family protein [Candidatus Acidulodesulfobacterium ferriphilum]|jgi:sulfite exporter TauE/SafE|uniref:Sulfite exporter TauE/SafE family protein n=1 Tax=Candidatus Acidulodesulfobacterium ferriphilum TaxID=2597223 RepID=A0A519BDW2_9DELT|nr:MAG: sulfite exporter TauE/SafE family protein [Candidatus Acidulodesulfobacterium ferriphilum]